MLRVRVGSNLSAAQIDQLVPLDHGVEAYERVASGARAWFVVTLRCKDPREIKALTSMRLKPNSESVSESRSNRLAN